MVLDVQKKLDELKANYSMERDNEACVSTFSIEDIGGSITVADFKASFVYGNGEHSIALDHKDAEKWLETYVQEDTEKFGEVVQETEWTDLKRCLFMDGYEAISDFLDYDYNEDEDEDTTENRLDEAYAQMPREEFVRFYRKHVLNIDD